MGQLVYIQLKSKSDAVIAEKNRVLDDLRIKNHFVTNEMNQNWLHDINAGDPAFNWMLNDGQPITMDDLHKYHPNETTVGLLSFDVSFSRTSQALAKKYAKFIAANVNSIEYLKGADELISRYKLTQGEIDSINALNKASEDPELLPVDEQNIPDLQSGLYLCKSWSPTPFWVVFGNVDSPTFMKVRKYKNDLYNNLYKDKKGYAYLLLPLMPINNKELEFVQKVYSSAWDMGLREEYTFIIPFIYGLEIMNFKEVANDFKEFYTPEEIQERFWSIFKCINSTFPYNHPNGFLWRGDKKMFKAIGEDVSPLTAKCNVLTCLLFAMGSDKAAELMTKLMNKKYLPIEFNY
jgi:hypothetical protein